MGSYGDRWLRCSWCSRWGQCKSDVPAPYASLLDADGVGVICIPCYHRCYPPHYHYLLMLLGVEWSVAVDIANYAYPICAQTAIDLDGDPDATGETLELGGCELLEPLQSGKCSARCVRVNESVFPLWVPSDQNCFCVLPRGCCLCLFLCFFLLGVVCE